MSNSIEEALKEAVKQVESGTVQEGKGAEAEQELSTRVKRLLARKTNLQRKRRTKLPKNLR
jgi:UDP-N-acetylmuramyl tripeptide synthase